MVAAFIGAARIPGQSGDGLMALGWFAELLALPVIVAALSGAGAIGGGVARGLGAWLRGRGAGLIDADCNLTPAENSGTH